MNQEVEMKCWVNTKNIFRIEKFLQEKTKFLEKSEKIDWYYADKNNPEKISFRLREENGKNIITQKNRITRENGMEVNEEREFEVSDAEKFRELCTAQNIPFLYQKIKRVKKYRKNDSPMLIEFVEISPLGKFLEIEILTNSQGVEEAEKEIFSLFKELDLLNDIEKKPYYQLIIKK